MPSNNGWLVFDPTGEADLNRRQSSSVLFNTLTGVGEYKERKKEYKEREEYNNKLHSVLSEGDSFPYGSSDNASLPDRLIRNGFMKEGQELGAYQQSSEKSDLDNATKRLTLAGQSFGWLKEHATPENAYRVLNDLVDSKLISVQTADRYRDEIKQDPSLVKHLADFGFTSSLPSAEQLPKYQAINTGGATRVAEINPITGSVKEAASFKNSESPNAILGASISRRGQDLDQQATLRGQDISSVNALKAGDLSKYIKQVELTSALRKEWEGLPEVKAYKNALSSYNSFKNAFSKDTPQSDIDIIYAIAKIYDPDSVVREGEYATIRNSQSIPDILKSAFERVMGDARLTKQTREQLRDEAIGRLNAYKGESSRASLFISEIAENNNLNVKEVVDPSLDTELFTPEGWSENEEADE